MAEPAAVSVAAPVSPPQGEFRVGRVLSGSTSILFGNLPQVCVLSALASLPYLLFRIGGGPISFGLTPKVGSAAYFGALLLNTVLTAFCQSIVLFGAFQAMRGRPFRVGESLSKGLTRFVPVLGTSLLSTLIAGVASLVIVPGLIVLAMYYVALPVCVVERLGPVDSLSRSADLTRGHRWKVFGLAILLLIAIGMVSAFAGAGLALLRSPPLLGIGLYLWETVARAIMAVVAVVTYHDLRVAKEGVDIEHIAAVFD